MFITTLCYFSSCVQGSCVLNYMPVASVDMYKNKGNLINMKLYHIITSISLSSLLFIQKCFFCIFDYTFCILKFTLYFKKKIQNKFN